MSVPVSNAAPSRIFVNLLMFMFFCWLLIIFASNPTMYFIFQHRGSSPRTNCYGMQKVTHLTLTVQLIPSAEVGRILRHGVRMRPELQMRFGLFALKISNQLSHGLKARKF